MRVQRLITAFLLSGAIAAPALAFDIKPGEWEMEMSGNAGGMAMPKQKMKFCVTPEQAKNSSEKMTTQNVPGGCKPKVTSTTSDSVVYEIACDQNGMKMDAKGSTKKVSDNEVVTNSTTTINANGQKMVQQSTITQKYIGPTCSSESMQPGQAGAPGTPKGGAKAPGK